MFIVFESYYDDHERMIGPFHTKEEAEVAQAYLEKNPKYAWKGEAFWYDVVELTRPSDVLL